MTPVRLSAGLVLADRYRLIAPLGDGGMGEVWSATQLVTGRSVAVKRLRCAPHETSFGEARARFALEARSACAVDHPNVVEVFDFIDQEGEAPFIVMELLEGETLAERLGRSSALSVAEAAELMVPVVSAVGTAHERGIVHRDIKPSNIFLAFDRGGRTRVKVLDFGIAKWLAGSREDRGLRTQTGSALGTPSYMAPEQATAERTVDHRADVWSLGVILYEALSGVRPLEGENAAQLVMRLLSSGIMPVEHLVPELPRELSALIGRMLSRDIGKRPEDLREVLDLLSGLTDVEGLSFGAPNSRVLAHAADSLEAEGDRDGNGGGSGDSRGSAAPLFTRTAIADVWLPPTQAEFATERASLAPPVGNRRRVWLMSALGLSALGAGLVFGGWNALPGERTSAPAEPASERGQLVEARLAGAGVEPAAPVPEQAVSEQAAESGRRPDVDGADQPPAPLNRRDKAAKVSARSRRAPANVLGSASRGSGRTPRAARSAPAVTSAAEPSSARDALDLTAANSAPAGEPATDGAAAPAGPALKLAGAECERSAECKSRLCVAFACQ